MCLVAVTTSLALPVVEAANPLDHVDNGAKADIHADLGEGLGEKANVESKQPTPTLNDIHDIMNAGMALWKEGEDKNGNEVPKKLNAAIGRVETKEFKLAAKQAEKMEENAAIKMHVKHPEEWAKTGAQTMEKGLTMAEQLVGDDVAQNERLYTKNKAVAAEDQNYDKGIKAQPDGKLIAEEFKISSNVEKMGVEVAAKKTKIQAEVLSMQANHDKQQAARELVEAKKDAAEAKLALNIHQQIVMEARAAQLAQNAKGLEIKAQHELDSAAKKSSRVRKIDLQKPTFEAVDPTVEKLFTKSKTLTIEQLGYHELTGKQIQPSQLDDAFSLLEVSEEKTPFRLPAVPLGHVHSEIITDVAQVVEKRTLVDDIIKQAMQKAEAEATPDWSVDKVIPTDHGVTNKAETNNNHLGISLIQLDPAQELEESIHKTPKSFKLPSLPVGDVQYKVDGQLPKVVAEEKLVAAEERGLEMLSDNGIENDANLTKLMSARDHVAAALLKATTELRDGVVPKLLL